MKAANTKPRHVAIIMDGNGRWAKQRHLPRVAGHKAGTDAVREVIKSCLENQIEVLTLFAFSSENWQRPATEVDYLMQLFISSLHAEAKKLQEQKIQLRVIGDRTRLNQKLQDKIADVEQMTASNTRLVLVLAVNYGGQWDVTQAMQRLAEEVRQGVRLPADINASVIQHYLCLADLPLPDLLIRTSGEQRISNFMLWQLSYSELYFTDVLWPDFNAQAFANALTYYADKERRFGRTSEQVVEGVSVHVENIK